MHQVNLDLSLEEITKIEGAATLDLKIRDGKVNECQFAISEFKRFYTQAIRGKPVIAAPQLVARICGTCSNAHLLCDIKALENGLNITPSAQTILLRQLLNYGLMIRDHALHLYVFVLPDIYKKESILAFDENDPEQHELLHDCFAVKSVGNAIGITAGGRSVHAPFASLGGFTKIPEKLALTRLIPSLKAIRPKVLKLIEVFGRYPAQVIQDVVFAALDDPDFSFLNGAIMFSDGQKIQPEQFGDFLTHTVIPYSQASAYTWKGQVYMVGALARLNLIKDRLHQDTRQDVAKYLAKFPSQNIFDNNLAQAIEILHSIDKSIELINQYQAVTETPPKIAASQPSTGIGVIEAPRGLLFHKMAIGGDTKINQAQIVVPTGQNHIVIENSIKTYVENNIDLPKEELSRGIEEVIRAFDPCMSCATHFLKVNWK